MEWIATIVVGTLTFLGTFYGSYSANKKQTAVMLYRLDELEKKQDKHNQLIERMYSLETKCEVVEERIENFGERIKELEK